MLGFIVVIIGIKEILAQNNDYVIHQAVKDFNPEFDMAFLNSELNLHFLEHSISQLIQNIQLDLEQLILQFVVITRKL